ncbi:MAG: oligosaccharide flippase family protein [Bacteroidia bacterium]
MLKSSFIKNTGVLFSGSLIAQLIGFGVVPILSRIYNPEDFGALGLFNSMVAIVTVFSGLRYEMAIVVEEDRSKARALTQLSMLWNIIIGLILMIVIVLSKNWIAGLFGINKPEWLYLVAPVIILSGMLESLIFWRNRERQFRLISANRVLSSATAASYKLTHPYINLPNNGLIIGHSIGQLLAFLHLWWKSGIQLFQFDSSLLKSLMKEYKDFPLYSAPAALINILAVKMPFFLIAYYAGMEATGFLDNANRLTYLPLSMVAMASSQVFFERIARVKKDKKQSAEMSHQLVNFLFFLGVLPVSILFVFGDDIVSWILGANWHQSGVYVQILILFYFSIFLTSPFSSAFEAYQKLKQQLVYNLIFLVCTSLAMWWAYETYELTTKALMAYAATALVLRLIILNYFFKLFGKSLLLKSLFGILITYLLIWLLFRIDSFLF